MIITSYKPVEPRGGEPKQPIKAYLGLVGLTGACWEDLAPLPKALMAHITTSMN